MAKVYSYDTQGGKRYGWCLDLGMRYDEAKGRDVRQQMRREGFLRKTDAEQAMRHEQHQIDTGTAPGLAERKLTVGEWADLWLASKAAIRPGTLANYRHVVNSYVRPAIGRVPLVQLRADRLDKMVGAMRSGELRPKVDKRGPDGKLSAATIRQAFAVVTIMLNSAVKRRLIPYNPAQGVELEPVPRKDKRVWTRAEAETFLAFAEQADPRLVIAWRIALSYGLRRGELAGLRWCDIDTDAGLLHVEQQLASVGELKPCPPKTDAGYRTVPLAVDPDFGAALREHRKRQLADRLAAGAEWQETGLVLAGPHGEPVPPWKLSTRFTDLVQQAGVPALTLHGCRRTANSLWAEAGVATLVRMEWAGWTDPAMADATYLKVGREAHDAAAAQAAAYRASR